MHAPRAKAGHYLASPTLLYNLLVAILFKSTSKLPIALLGGTTSSPFTLECQIYPRLHHSINVESLILPRKSPPEVEAQGVYPIKDIVEANSTISGNQQ